MANDNNELKNNAPCEDKQEARQLTEEELEQVTGGSNPIPGAEFVNLGYDGLNQKDIELQVEMKRKYNAEPVAYDFR